MTTTKSAPLAHASGRSGPGAYYRRPTTTSSLRAGDDRGAHLLRLVLDLQLDALLLGLGAAAVQESRFHPSAVPSPSHDALGTPPWPRWAAEDIDLARTLAAEAVSSGAALPATLGPEPAAQEEPVVLDRLAARYESMENLLTDLLARAGDDAPAARSHLHELMGHCRQRLLELRSVARTTRRTDRPPSSTRPVERKYLPGELLG
jgi:hypothetical protein